VFVVADFLCVCVCTVSTGAVFWVDPPNAKQLDSPIQTITTPTSSGPGVETLALSIAGGAVTTLTELGLSSVEMDAQGALALANALASPLCNVAVLSIDSNPDVGHQGVIALSSIALKRTSCPLTTLRMGNVGLRRKKRSTVAAAAVALPQGERRAKSVKDKNKINTEYHLPVKEQKFKREVAPTVATPVPLFRPFVEHARYAAAVWGVGEEGEKEIPQSKSPSSPENGGAGHESKSSEHGGQDAGEAAGATKDGSAADAERDADADDGGGGGGGGGEAKKGVGVGETRFENAFDALGYALTQNKTLTSFDLSGAREIDDEAMAPLAAALGRNEGLHIVLLSGNCIGDEGACLIADALEDNPNGPLHTLDVHDNCVGDEGAANIAEVLGVDNKSLTTLDLRSQRARLGGDAVHPVPIGAPVDTEGIMAFATMLKTNCTLTSLDLRGNGMLDLERTVRVVATDAFAKATLRAVVYNPRACVLRVWGADFARVARVCYLPEEYHRRGANEDREAFNLRILRFAHRMDL
jgi:hypothetical protein